MNFGCVFCCGHISVAEELDELPNPAQVSLSLSQREASNVAQLCTAISFWTSFYALVMQMQRFISSL